MSYGFDPTKTPSPAALPDPSPHDPDEVVMPKHPLEPPPQQPIEHIVVPPLPPELGHTATLPEPAPTLVEPTDTPAPAPENVEFLDIVAHQHRRRGWMTIPIAIIVIGAIAGGIALSRERGKSTIKQAGKTADAQDVGSSATTTTTKPTYSYLTPKSDSAWDYTGSDIAYDTSKGVTKYSVTLKGSSSNQVTISQQLMPGPLKPRTSANFISFINDSKATKSQDAGLGTLYFIPAVSGPGSVDGAATVIFATDDILLFGRSDTVVPYATWAKLMTAMKMTAP